MTRRLRLQLTPSPSHVYISSLMPSLSSSEPDNPAILPQTDDDLLTADYVDERSVDFAPTRNASLLTTLVRSHIETFAHALQAEFFVENEYVDTPRSSSIFLPNGQPSGSPALTPLSPPPPSAHHTPSARTPRIRKISALSDFAPVNLRVKKRKKGAKHHTNDRRQEWLFVLVRWPLLVRE